MIISILVTVLFTLFLYLSHRKIGFHYNIKEIVSALRIAGESPMKMSSMMMFITLFFWITLPMFWGLAFYLKSDANVVVVLLTIFWGYYNLKYIYPIKSE